MTQAQHVHGEPYAPVQQRPRPPGLALKGHVSQREPRDDGPQGLGQGLAKVNHAVRDRHDDDGVVPEASKQGEDEEASMEGKESGV